MIAGLLVGVLMLAPADSLDRRDPSCPGGAVVTRRDLEAAGATTLHDALRIAGVPGVNIHGFDVVPTATLGVPFASGVRVLLDGAPVVRGGGAEPLGVEALPVAVAEVARVVVCPGAGVAGGAFGGPWIDVQTEPPPGRAYLAATYGNESGDPGPLRYLDPSLPNVDRWGPDYEGGAVARTPRATVWMTLRDRDFLPTDPAVLDRTNAATHPGQYPKRFGTVAALAARAYGLRWRAGVRRFEDLPFLSGLQTEVPIGHVSAQATVSGERQRGDARVWGHAHVGHVRLDRPRWGALPLDPSWQDLRADAALAASVTSGGSSLAGGARATTIDAEAPGFAHRGGLGRAWLQARTSVGATGAGVTIAGAAAGRAADASGQAEAWWTPAPALRLHLAATAQRVFATEVLDAHTWAALGDLAYRDPGGVRPEPLSHVRVTLGGAPGGRTAWQLGLVAQRGSEAATPWGPARGRALTGTARAGWRGARADASVQASVRPVVTGTSGYRAAWARLPRATAAAHVAVRPDARLSLWARFSVASGTTWRGAVDPDLPAQALLDLGLSKRAWGDRVRVSIAGRNVLGADERSHPLGAPLAPRLFVRAEARL